MPIHALSGMPGNGKTALMMEMLMAAALKAERPIFHSGIAGISSGLGTELSDPKKWNDIDPNGEPVCDCRDDGIYHAHMLPNGALHFIDEAWQWFGHLQDATKQATPKHVLDLAQHRHRGIDFVWTFQSPNQLFPFVRGLIQDHWHVVRKWGTQVIDVYKWPEFQESVKSNSVRSSAMKDVRTLPKKVFGKYKSASEHTIKTKLPWRVYLLPLGIIAVLLSGFYIMRYLSPEAAMERTGANPATSLPSAAGKGGGLYTPQSNNATYEAIDTLPKYLKQITPLTPVAPWSAPAFGELEPVSEPMIYCMSSCENTNNPDCNCITEQGTTYLLPISQCTNIARNGLYNPNKEPSQQRNETAIAPPKFLPVESGSEGSLRMGDAL